MGPDTAKHRVLENPAGDRIPSEDQVLPNTGLFFFNREKTGIKQKINEIFQSKSGFQKIFWMTRAFFFPTRMKPPKSLWYSYHVSAL